MNAENFKKLINKKDNFFLLDGFDTIVNIQRNESNLNINFDNIFKKIKNIVLKNKILKQNLSQNVDAIYVGEFDFLGDEIGSIYENNAIFVNSFINKSQEYFQNIIHEFGHAIYQNNEELRYNKNIEDEFKLKRERSFDVLNAKNYVDEDVHHLFFCMNFNQDFDELLFDKVGEGTIQYFLYPYFSNIYSITSLEEYFAYGFEIYLIGKTNQKEKLKRVSPNLFLEIWNFLND